MNKHVTNWLEAYHDGELDQIRTRLVEKHLDQCPACQQELAELQALSACLQESPAASDLMPENQFVTQVNLQLSRRPDQTAWQKGLETAWRLIPVGLLGAWGFMQTVIVVTGIIFLLARLGLDIDLFPAAPGPSTLDQWLEIAPGNLGELGTTVVRTLGNGGPFGWGFALSIAIPIVIGVLYWSWLASWWIRHQFSPNTE